MPSAVQQVPKLSQLLLLHVRPDVTYHLKYLKLHFFSFLCGSWEQVRGQKEPRWQLVVRIPSLL